MATTTSRDRDFEGLVAVVTGGAGGIGAACVAELHRRGARVACIDLAVPPGVADTATLIYLSCNVACEDVVAAVFATVVARFGKSVDILICMAAVFTYGEVHLVTDADWDRVLAVNIKGTAFSCKAVIPGMRAQKSGAIVLTSSITGTLAFPAFVPYSATKAAIMQMTRDMSLDNGRFGIRVNCLAPGPILTQGGTVAHAIREGRPLEEMCEELSRDVALRRMGNVGETAKAVCFLASDDASYVTGTTLMCDGGFQRK